MKRLVIALVVILCILKYYPTLKINLIVFLTIQRGILTTNCSWWTLSNLFTSDTTGCDLYYTIQHKSIQQYSILGREIHIVFKNDYIQEILNQSPFTFGVGKLKYEFFRSFMPYNVGVSEGDVWVRRRQMNEHVLDKAVDVNVQWNYSGLPTNYSEFTSLGRFMMGKIVFGVKQTPEALVNIFKEANSLFSLFSTHFSVPSDTYTIYREYIKNAYRQPSSPQSLVSYIPSSNLSQDEVLDQIPHWMFPIMGLFSNIIPRVILLMLTHPEYISIDSFHLRYCILESLRLNNPVNSTFRTSLKQVQLDKLYDKGTQFLIINNPILRNPNVFPNPNQFVPTRWTPELEQSYYALMFNQGPQICPGKELVIQIATQYIQYYLTKIKGHTISVYPKIDRLYIPQMINPCEIKFVIQPNM